MSKQMLWSVVSTVGGVGVWDPGGRWWRDLSGGAWTCRKSRQCSSLRGSREVAFWLGGENGLLLCEEDGKVFR